MACNRNTVSQINRHQWTTVAMKQQWHQWENKSILFDRLRNHTVFIAVCLGTFYSRIKRTILNDRKSHRIILVMLDAKDWNKADKACNSVGASLVAIDSENYNQWIRGLVQVFLHIWITLFNSKGFIQQFK